MIFNPDDPSTWPSFRPLIIAHDVGRSRDRSTAVIGGNCPAGPPRLGIAELEELAQGLYGSARASALAVIDRRYNCNALIVADLSNDATYAEILFETFGPRVIGLHISRNGDGANAERRPVKNGAMLVYTIGRSYLIELLHSELQSDQVRFVDGPTSRRAYEQLMGLETEMRESRSSIAARPDNTMTSASPVRCWPGRRGIRICRFGSARRSRRAGRASRVKATVGEPLRNDRVMFPLPGLNQRNQNIKPIASAVLRFAIVRPSISLRSRR